jgi:hypothetical protein
MPLLDLPNDGFNGPIPRRYEDLVFINSPRPFKLRGILSVPFFSFVELFV